MKRAQGHRLINTLTILAAMIPLPVLAQLSDVPRAAYITNGEVHAVAMGADGSTYIGGSFTTVGPATGSGIVTPADGDGHPVIIPQVAGGQVLEAVPDESGGWYIAGSFTHVAGVARNRIAHILPDGSLNPTWNPNANHMVDTIALSGDEVFFGGWFTTVNGSTTRNRIAKTSAAGDGTVDPTWNPNADGGVYSIAVSGGEVFFGGAFTTVNGSTTRNRIAKTSAAGDGTVDPTWNPNASLEVNAIAVSGGEVFFGGGFTTVNGSTTRNRIAKTATTGDGTVSATWNPNADSWVRAITVSEGEVFFGGDFSTVNGSITRNRIAKTATTGDGTVSGSWNPSASNVVYTIAVSEGEVFFGGFFGTVNGTTRRMAIAKTPAAGDGTVDPTWNPNPNNGVFTIAVSAGEVFFGGQFTSAGPDWLSRANLAKLDPNGTVAPDWNPGANGVVDAIAVSGGEVFFGGGFTTVNGSTTRNRIAKTSAAGDGTVDPTWNPNANGNVSSIAVSGGEVFFGGHFTTVNGSTTRYGIAKTPAGGDGAVDPTWNPSVNGYVDSIAASGGEVFFGGGFSTVNGSTARNAIAKTATIGDGTVDPTWNPNANNNVWSIAVSGGEVFFGGWFTTVNGSTTRNRIAKTAATGDGTVDPMWNPNCNNGVSAIAVSGGNVFFGGYFTTVNGATIRNRIAKTAPTGDGAVDPAWNPNANSNVFAIAAWNSTVSIGGAFFAVNGYPARGVAQFSIPLISVSPEPPGDYCPTGGQRIDLSAGQWTVTTTYICNGESGDAGESANVTVTDEPAGFNCANGGQKIETSVGTGPVVTSYVCNGLDGADGADGVSAVALAEPPGVNCTYGGVKITSAGDDQYVCNGAPGADGADGTDGQDGQDVTVTIEPPGANCYEGGFRLESVSGTSYVCHGESASVVVTTEPAGVNCPAGGNKIETSVGSGPVTTSYLCNGESGDAGESANVTVTDEPAGFNCANGGQKIETSVGTGPVVTSYVCNGADGSDGLDGVSAVAVAEAPGVNCTYGGIKVTSAGDDQYVCNGAPGADGTDGTDGQDVTVTIEPPGVNCYEGGFRLESVSGTSYVCHGESASVVVTMEPAGANCSAGGQRLDVSVGSGPVTTSYVCNGESGDDGESAAISVMDEPPGTNCPAGGQRIDTSVGEGAVVTSYVCDGTDSAGLVAVAEGPGHNCAYGGIKVTSSDTELYVCNGAPGVDGSDGEGGLDGAPGSDGRDSLVMVTDEPSGENCAEGGVRISFGVDENDNGVLDPDEVRSESFVCNPPSSGCSATGGGPGGSWPAALLIGLLLLTRGWRRRQAP